MRARVAQLIGPVGAWLASPGRSGVPGPAWVLVRRRLWDRGFDLIYACQDVDIVGRRRPHCAGPICVLRVVDGSTNRTLVTLGLFRLVTGFLVGFGWPWWVGLAVTAVDFSGTIHAIVKPSDLSRVNRRSSPPTSVALCFFVFALVVPCWCAAPRGVSAVGRASCSGAVGSSVCPAPPGLRSPPPFCAPYRRWGTAEALSPGPARLTILDETARRSGTSLLRRLTKWLGTISAAYLRLWPAG